MKKTFIIISLIISTVLTLAFNKEIKRVRASSYCSGTITCIGGGGYPHPPYPEYTYEGISCRTHLDGYYSICRNGTIEVVATDPGGAIPTCIGQCEGAPGVSLYPVGHTCRLVGQTGTWQCQNFWDFTKIADDPTPEPTPTPRPKPTPKPKSRPKPQEIIGWTCCTANADGSASSNCNECVNQERKNFGDSCGNNPNCGICSTDFPKSNRCSLGTTPPPAPPANKAYTIQFPAKFTQEGSKTTDITSIPVDKLPKTNLVIDDATNVSLNFHNMNLTNDEIVQALNNTEELIQSSYRKIHINSDRYHVFKNIPATITFKNIGRPKSGYKFEVYRNDKPAKNIKNFNYKEKTQEIVFDVDGFSTYSIVETPIEVTNTKANETKISKFFSLNKSVIILFAIIAILGILLLVLFEIINQRKKTQ